MSFQPEHNPLLQALGKALCSGDFEQDFKARTIFGIAIVSLLLCIPTMAVDVFNREWSLVLVVSAGGLSMCAVVALVVFTRRVQWAVNLTVCTLLAMMVALLIARQGATLGFYVGVPTVIFLASILASRRFAWATLVACTLLFFCAAYLSHSYWRTEINLADPVLAAGGVRVGIVTLIFTFFSVGIYRRASDIMRKELSAAEINLSTANNALLDALEENIASVKMLMRLHDIGDVIGWWYDTNCAELHYTCSDNHNSSLYASAFKTITRAQVEQMPADSWQYQVVTNIEQTCIQSGCGDGVEWDEELRCCDGEQIVWYRNSGHCEFEKNEISRIIGVLHNVSESKQLTDRLAHQASYDDLTGLLNRRAVQTLLARHVDRSKFAKPAIPAINDYVLFLDLDRFKLVNDISGHAAGDKLLVKVSGLIKSSIRNDDIVGRLGGDEFIVILNRCEESTAAAIAETIRAAIDQLHFGWGDEMHRIGVSIGMVPIDPAIKDIEHLRQLADAACYAAKAEGRNRVRAMRAGEHTDENPEQEQKRLVQRIHDALENDRFVLYGQKIAPVAGRQGLHEKIEILLRMVDAQTGEHIAPGVFLPIAEHYGLASNIDQWVVQQLIAKLQAMPAIADYQGSFWINLSGHSLGDEKFANFLVNAVEACGLPAGMLNFEVTETALVQNMDKAVAMIGALRMRDCAFALDDFGSGQSSFGYLKNLPVDVVKIDGLFIKNILNDDVDAIFTQSIVDVAHAINMQVVAEFVEDLQIAEKVSELGADYIQGYGIHEPEELDGLLHSASNCAVGRVSNA
ncbi:MAG: EAL domain-containing protein [Pseudomonadales bacterium]|nr:EAL domain-containing protein [Pseudomonadales bacterium]